MESTDEGNLVVMLLHNGIASTRGIATSPSLMEQKEGMGSTIGVEDVLVVTGHCRGDGRWLGGRDRY